MVARGLSMVARGKKKTLIERNPETPKEFKAFMTIGGHFMSGFELVGRFIRAREWEIKNCE
jgi:hypothetical protein